MKKLIILVFSLSFLYGCAMTAHLYPANDAAVRDGILEAHYVAWGTGHVELSITMPDGEKLKGEASLVQGGSIGFGSIITRAYGSTSVSSGVGEVIPGGSPGRASVFGDNGTRGECEYYNDNWSGHGYGACKISRKDKEDEYFRLQY